MEDPIGVIYVCDLSAPYLTQDFQKDVCETICKMKEIKCSKIIRDNTEDRTNLNLLLEGEKDYTHIIIYSFACLGSGTVKIIDSIKKILDKNLQVISVSDPVNISSFGNEATQNLLLTVAIASAVFQNDTWKEINNFKSNL